jgi:hypothetical protein
MAMGAESRDFFGFAQGKEQSEDGPRYVGFSFGTRTTPILDNALLLIAPHAASTWASALKATEDVTRSAPTAPPAATTGTATDPIGDGTTAPPIKKQFYASIELDPIQAKKQFADLVDEVVMQFTSRPGVKVKIAIEIQAESPTGFDDGVQRAVKENCKVLRFNNAEFESPGE